MTQAQGFLNKLKQKDTPSNQLRRSATYRLSSGVPLCLRTVFAERPLLAPDDFNVTILSAFSLPHPSFQSDCLGAIHLPPGRSVHLSLYSVFRSSVS
nr:MAG TPA: hypothetical protein [Caudoviricetes sp.]